MTIETRFPSMSRSTVLYSYGGLELVGPQVLTVTADRLWGPENQDMEDAGWAEVAAELGVPDGTLLNVTFKVMFPYDQGEGLAKAQEYDVPAGRYIVEDVSVRFLRKSPTSTDLGKISFPKLLRVAINSVRGEYRIRTLDPDTGDLVTRSFSEPAELGLAGAWAYGRLLGEDPTKYVAEVFGISRSAAAQRVARSRPAQLPPTRRGVH